MNSNHPDQQTDQRNKYHSYYAQSTIKDRLQQPSVLISLVLFLAAFYQYLHSSPISRPRHPGQLLWDFIIAITPATVLYALDGWLHPPTSTSTSPSTRTVRSSSYIAKSQLLRRILGMDGPGNIISSVADAGRRGLSSLSNASAPLLKRETDQPPGLGNYDNSCFQNSILQGLSSLEPLPNYLAKGLEHDELQGDEELGSASSLRNLLAKLTDSTHNGQTLWTPKKLKSLDTWQQQDAQEYFSKILDEVEKEIMKATKPQRRSSGFDTAGVRDDTESSQHSDDSGYQSLPILSKPVSDARSLRNPLEGLMAQRVACIQCGHSDGLSMTPFNCLTLNLGLDQTEHNLYERLDSYTDLETIDEVECTKCTLLKLQRLLGMLISRNKNHAASTQLQELISRKNIVDLALEEDDFEDKTLKEKCRADKRITATKTKQVVIARPPQSLAIHMNRSVFDETTGDMFKNLAAVRYPRTLDLGPWCLGSAGGSSAADNGIIGTLEDEEQWITNPKASMVSGDREKSRITGPLYELRAVITHQGRHENGHYVCYRRHPQKPSKLNDSFVKEAGSLNGDDESVLADDNSNNTDPDAGGKWWRLSDESVWEVSEETVLAQGGVFMLFYDCVDPNSVLVSTIQHEINEHNTDTNSLAQQEVTDCSSTPHHDLTQTALLKRNSINQMSERVELKLDYVRPHEVKHSSLTPPLADGEQVDPAIPLHRPNS